MASSENLSKPITIKPWEYKLDHTYTKEALNSDGLIAKAARYSVVGIALLAIAETITEIVKLPFKFIGNLFGLYNYTIFSTKETFKDVELVDQDKPIEQDSPEKKKELQELARKTQAVNNKMSVWKKVLGVAGGILGVSLLGWGGYNVYLYYSLPSGKDPLYLPSPEKARSILSKEQAGGYPVSSVFEAPDAPRQAEARFVDEYVKKEQCPAIEVFIKDQKEKGYWGWSLDNMKKLFGSERDLTLTETRNDLYHGLIQKNLPKIAEGRLGNSKGLVDEKIEAEIAMDICQLRKTARNYARQRSYQWNQKWLEKHEPRNKSCKYYVKEKCNGNLTKVLESAGKSNSFYDSPGLLRVCDIAHAYMPTFLRPIARKLLLFF